VEQQQQQQIYCGGFQKLVKLALHSTLGKAIPTSWWLVALEASPVFGAKDGSSSGSAISTGFHSVN